MIQNTIALLALTLMVGCQTSPDGSHGIATTVKTAAYVGTSLYLTDHPDARVEFERAAYELEQVERAEVIDFPTILAIVNRLPVKELKSDEARIIITGATIILADYAGQLRLDQMEQLRPIARALKEGIALGLGERPSEIQQKAQQ